MIETKSMTVRRTEAFLREIGFDQDIVRRKIIEAFAKDGNQVTMSPQVQIRLDPMVYPKLPSDGRYIVMIKTEEKSGVGWV